jgi:hypothetical protein
VIADFESHPNRRYGNVGVYGDGEPEWPAISKVGFKQPYSWYYEKDKPGYNKANVHSGFQSFRLVNATTMCMSRNKGWASLGIDLGPTAGEGPKVKPLDVSNYKYLAFWAKTDSKTDIEVQVVFRDAHSTGYLPQASVSPARSQRDNSWQKYAVDLAEIRKKLDLKRLVHVGLAFGQDVGNPPGTIMYVDDFAFAGSDTETEVSNGAEMPVVFPQHWPHGGVAATAWLIFAELDMNPFAPSLPAP